MPLALARRRRMYDGCTALDGLLTPYLVGWPFVIRFFYQAINGGRQYVAYLTCSITIVD
jgi:hypothetical protein